MPNTFGHLFRITTWGESHGKGVGVVVDGCPSNIPLTESDIQKELDRRRPGQSKITTQRKEKDIAEILSGTFNGMTLGTPILILVRNEDARPEAYAEMEHIYRPSHADYTYQIKYGIRNWQGGGRASARETVGRVAGGAVGGKLLEVLYPSLEVIAWVSEVHGVKSFCDPNKITKETIESNILRWPDSENFDNALKEVEKAQKEGDTVGGVIDCVVRGMPPGLGEPVFDKLEADLAKAMLSLPASKGFEIGSGFQAARMRGSEHNDPFYMEGKRVRTYTNWSGGVQGGISNGENLFFRVAFKPVATLAKEQKTVTVDGEEVLLRARGRHDPCVLPRAVPIVEAMTKLVLADHALRQKVLDCRP
ncbi:chorismate synthase [Methylacidiphilum kamchatkense Kam1]|uniref:Chorismate synthase n=1 Tax=Methylacidiphilum kamchatkense Kam1 TaxID=1202785 RepID=A0A0C1V5D8_9BACT|nr:chorismate synthase [Methylacidiphilum kamchatkense]KIE58950.1 chorismate synthase [Methylacidiphilum kamchatkense Kam1]QDQ43168.1 chorismate synthase [Methylacidiphilum kamchatkense Kam1]